MQGKKKSKLQLILGRHLHCVNAAPFKHGSPRLARSWAGCPTLGVSEHPQTRVLPVFPYSSSKSSIVQGKHRKEAFGRSCSESQACGLSSQTITITAFCLEYPQERKVHFFLWHAKQWCGRRQSNSAKEPGRPENFSGTHRGQWDFCALLVTAKPGKANTSWVFLQRNLTSALGEVQMKPILPQPSFCLCSGLPARVPLGAVCSVPGRGDTLNQHLALLCSLEKTCYKSGELIL